MVELDPSTQSSSTSVLHQYLESCPFQKTNTPFSLKEQILFELILGLFFSQRISSFTPNKLIQLLGGMDSGSIIDVKIKLFIVLTFPYKAG